MTFFVRMYNLFNILNAVHYILHLLSIFIAALDPEIAYLEG